MREAIVFLVSFALMLALGACIIRNASGEWPWSHDNGRDW